MTPEQFIVAIQYHKHFGYILKPYRATYNSKANTWSITHNFTENHDSPESPRQNPHRKADSEDPIEKSITGLIMGFKLEEKTPLDAMMFINDLQKRIRLGSC